MTTIPHPDIVASLKDIAIAIQDHAPCSDVKLVEQRVSRLESESRTNSQLLQSVHTSIIKLEQSVSDREKRDVASRWLMSLLVPIVVSITITVLQHFSK